MTDIPRRCDVQQMTPAELAIRNAIAEVEKGEADVRLTDAVVLLQAAQDAVADYIEDVARRRHVVTREGLEGAL